MYAQEFVGYIPPNPEPMLYELASHVYNIMLNIYIISLWYSCISSSITPHPHRMKFQ